MHQAAFTLADRGGARVAAVTTCSPRRAAGGVLEEDGGETYARRYEGLRRASGGRRPYSPGWPCGGSREDIQPGSSLSGVLAGGVCAIARWRRTPYVVEGAGFEVELAELAVQRIARRYDQALTTDWVEVSVQPPATARRRSGSSTR